MNIFHLALRHLRREWRAGELTVLAIALVIAVASVASVNFFYQSYPSGAHGAGERFAGRRPGLHF